MKNQLVALGALVVFGIALSLNLKSESISFNEEALAAGTCCPEDDSVCVTPTWNIANHYGKESGSCKEDKISPADVAIAANATTREN